MRNSPFTICNHKRGGTGETTERRNNREEELEKQQVVHKTRAEYSKRVNKFHT